MQGNGYASFLVWAFNLWKSIQNCRVPSFFQTKTMALHHRDWDGQMAPPSSLSCKFCWTSSSKGGAICQNHSLKGSSSSSPITCSAASMQPISFLSREKMWWGSISFCSNFKASSGGHSLSYSSPLSSRNSSISNFCCSSIVSLGHSSSGNGSCSSNFFRSSGEVAP